MKMTKYRKQKLLHEAYRIFADALNYDENTLISYCNLVKSIYGKEYINSCFIDDNSLKSIHYLVSSIAQKYDDNDIKELRELVNCGIIVDRIAVSDRDILLSKLIDIVSNLPSKNKTVLCYRYGLNGCKASTLKEIGIMFNLTSERIRQILSKTLIMMRHPTRLANTSTIIEERINCLNNYSNVAIDLLDFSTRTYNALRRGGISTIGELIKHEESELMHIRNLGKTSVKEIISKLESINLSLKS